MHTYAIDFDMTLNCYSFKKTEPYKLYEYFNDVDDDEDDGHYREK